MAQNWLFWSFWARPCRLIWGPVSGLVGGCGARAVYCKTPIYFIHIYIIIYIFPNTKSRLILRVGSSILENVLYAILSQNGNVAIYALFPGKNCVENLAFWKVFTFYYSAQTTPPAPTAPKYRSKLQGTGTAYYPKKKHYKY